MTKFNQPENRPATTSPVKSEGVASDTTYEGAPGYARDIKSELFLLAVANFVREDTFYEMANERDQRYRDLVREAAVVDPDWTAGLLKWLRSDANMRSASIVGAAEYAWARRDEMGTGRTGEVHPTPSLTTRQVVSAVIQRADEPGEMIAYWASQYGKNFPKPVKRGIGDAMIRLGTEFNYLKWDSEGAGYRWADILNLTHPGDKKGSRQWFQGESRDEVSGEIVGGEFQRTLFGHVIAKAYDNETPTPESLDTLTRREALMSLPVDERRRVLENPETLRRAGLTWEALAGWLQSPMDKEAWEAIIPSMQIFALVRNLRNFDQAGVSDKIANQVAAKLMNPEVIAKSRMFPFRFLAAHRNAPSLRWAYPLEVALNYSLLNTPVLKGHTLILVDRSGSMFFGHPSKKSDMSWADTAAVFGAALALRIENSHRENDSADLIEFGTDSQPVRFQRGESLLKAVEKFSSMGGTNTAGAVRRHFLPGFHERVVIITDEQAWGGYRGENPTEAVPDGIPVYTWNLAGYKYGHGPSGEKNRHTFAGLTDQAFRMIPLLEAGKNAQWPWEQHRIWKR
jgi:TROVE domain